MKKKNYIYNINNNNNTEYENINNTTLLANCVKEYDVFFTKI